MESLRRRAGKRGLTMIELTVALAIAAILLLFVAPYLFRIYRRERLKSAVREVHAVVLATRMEAVKRNRNAVLFVDVANRRIFSWTENLPYNFVQDAGEGTIHEYMLPGFVILRYPPDGPVDGPNAVAFDMYNGDAALVDRVVFRGDGTLVDPQAVNSKPPQKPDSPVPYLSVDCKVRSGPGPGECRGIYLTDRTTTADEQNTFRISVNDYGQSGKVSLLKWLPQSQGGGGGEENFVPPPWTWVD